MANYQASTMSAGNWASLSLGQSGRSLGLLDGLRRWLHRQREIARVTRELSVHTDRELHDMGLTRGDIPAVARGTYYLP